MTRLRKRLVELGLRKDLVRTDVGGRVELLLGPDDLAADAPIEPLIRHVLAAAEAVAYAHNRGVVHRDLEPGNIMIGPFGETRVIDRGLAIDGTDQPDGPRAGTVSSMSPDQARREPIDARADLNAQGLISGAALHRDDWARGGGPRA